VSDQPSVQTEINGPQRDFTSTISIRYVNHVRKSHCTSGGSRSSLRPNASNLEDRQCA